MVIFKMVATVPCLDLLGILRTPRCLHLNKALFRLWSSVMALSNVSLSLWGQADRTSGNTVGVLSPETCTSSACPCSPRHSPWPWSLEGSLAEETVSVWGSRAGGRAGCVAGRTLLQSPRVCRPAFPDWGGKPMLREPADSSRQAGFSPKPAGEGQPAEAHVSGRCEPVFRGLWEEEGSPVTTGRAGQRGRGPGRSPQEGLADGPPPHYTGCGGRGPEASCALRSAPSGASLLLFSLHGEVFLRCFFSYFRQNVVVKTACVEITGCTYHSRKAYKIRMSRAELVLAKEPACFGCGDTRGRPPPRLVRALLRGSVPGARKSRQTSNSYFVSCF